MKIFMLFGALALFVLSRVRPDIPYLFQAAEGLLLFWILLMAGSSRRSKYPPPEQSETTSRQRPALHWGRREAPEITRLRLIVALLGGVMGLGMMAMMFYNNYQTDQERARHQSSPEGIAERENSERRHKANDLYNQAAVEYSQVRDGITPAKEAEQALVKALKLLDESLLLNPDASDSWYQVRYRILVELQRFDLADQAFQGYLDKGGKLEEYPQLLYTKGELQRALEACEQILKTRRPCPTVILKMRLLVELKKRDEAMDYKNSFDACDGQKNYDEVNKKYEQFIEKR